MAQLAAPSNLRIRAVIRRPALVLASLVILVSGCAGDGHSPGAQGACPARLMLDGDIYNGHPTDDLVSGAPLGRTATVPACDDNLDGKVMTEPPVKIAAVPGVKAEKAFIAPSMETHIIFVKRGLDQAEVRGLIDKAGKGR